MCRSAHDAAVDRLRAAMSSLPPGSPVRLGKPSSNLFRFGARDRVPGLPVDGLDTVITLDADARTVEAGGLITYERLVAATLPHKLMPAVVPQLRTITLGGAVAGLGIESTSFRSGLPHESVITMDVLTPSGELVTVTDDDALFQAFPNSYGTLGYAVRLVIRLEPVGNAVALTHHRHDSAAETFDALARLWDDPAVDFVDGVGFDTGELYLTTGRFDDAPGPTSDYTGQAVYYRSIRERDTDRLTIHDYLWRWDTDWFWCSAAFGVQNRFIRPLWPRPYRRSDVYRRLVGLDRRVGLSRTLSRLRGGRREAVIQDVEIPLPAAAAFFDEFCARIPIRPVWICPLRTADDRRWPLYPLPAGEPYVNFGFWATAALPADAPDDHFNREVERLVAAHGGHKSLYSTVHYDREEFWRGYDLAAYRAVKDRYDPDRRMPELYDKVVGDHATR
ncbi:FAD/FMN-containing dehydrogenase [Stackebrandtia albiflava]|uniref:Delta(24)-sterol reductase n=1 Tax=Stackebrandtia albiflava TaxID=406432 RepID=A0A562V1S9_9ACTN|nr:FAD-binding oxidoreductase [Stackebrandtia albiflava]TWJ11834.1 FAD/FMN-containing dehydrogenase [Stackebrandtia albiflava]